MQETTQLSYDELYKAYITSYSEEWSLWEAAFGNGHSECEKAVEIFHAKTAFTKQLWKAVVLHPETTAHTITFCGCEENYDIEHYSIDVAMKEMFGDTYTADSESGSFFGGCRPEVLSQVKAIFESCYPTLKVGFYDAVEQLNSPNYTDEDYVGVYIPGANNWQTAAETLKKLEA